MNLSAPTMVVFLISLAIAVLGAVGWTGDTQHYSHLRILVNDNRICCAGSWYIDERYLATANTQQDCRIARADPSPGSNFTAKTDVQMLHES